MKKQKTLFVSRVANLSKETILIHTSLPYTKIILLYDGKKDAEKIKIPSKLEIIPYKNLTILSREINKIYEQHTDYLILPNFWGDAFSKYAIKMYDKTYGSKIDPKIFKEKDVMMRFVGQVWEKNYLRTSYKDLVHTSYADIENKIWQTFIVKPTNASSSRCTFKVTSQEDFESIKTKISRVFDYMVEEYIEWELYSVDVFMDGEDMFLLTYAREIAMIELADKKKFSPKFLEKYGEEIDKHFNFILPIAYHIDFSFLSKMETSLLEELRQKLEEIKYRGVIHLEYKYDKKAKKIWFLEWGGRYGGYRKTFVKEIYNTDHLRIPYYLLVENDRSRFTPLKWKIYSFKEQEYNLNFVRMKTNFLETINYIDILKKTGNIFEVSFQKFLKDYYRENFGIKIKKIDFFVKYSKGYNFFPFYKDASTKLDYILELDDENFELFKKKKFKIIEKTFFHDYK